MCWQDEPTSGLDAAAAFHVTSVIKRLCASGGACASGRTVLCVIHQPASEVFELFDTLALLAGGATVYFGPAQTVADFFATVGMPAPRNRSASDHMLHTVNADFGDAHDVNAAVERLLEAYEASPTRADVEQRIAAVEAKPGPRFESGQAPPPAWRQMLVLTKRSFTNNWRDIGIFWMRLAMVRTHVENWPQKSRLERTCEPCACCCWEVLTRPSPNVASTSCSALPSASSTSE